MNAPPAAEAHWFVAPPLDGPITGGTLYNREMVRALTAAGARAAAIDDGEAARALAAGEPGWYWVDTLYLDAFPALHAAARAHGRLGLLAHYLPSLVREPPSVTEPGAEERFALEHARAFVAPSPFLAGVLARHGTAPAAVVEPGRSARGVSDHAGAGADAPLAATLVANLLPPKGVEPFLEALDRALGEGGALTLSIIGGDRFDAAYSARCRALVAGRPGLAARVRFDGALTPESVVARLSASDLVISASRMESYGMVLAEARALGIPIVARRAGNTPALVRADAGGELVDDDAALARAALELARDRTELARRRAAARARALPPRPWSEAAAELTAFARRVPARPPAPDGTRRRTNSRTTR